MICNFHNVPNTPTHLDMFICNHPNHHHHHGCFPVCGPQCSLVSCGASHNLHSSTLKTQLAYTHRSPSSWSTDPDNSISSLTAQLTSVKADNKAMKETILDLQKHSMRDNLVFSRQPQSHSSLNPTSLSSYIHIHIFLLLLLYCQ